MKDELAPLHRWRSAKVATNPVFAPFERVFFADTKGRLFALDGSGNRMQLYQSSVGVGSDLVLTADGYLLFSNRAGEVLSLGAAGLDFSEIKWRFQTSSRLPARAIVPGVDTVIIISGDGRKISALGG